MRTHTSLTQNIPLIWLATLSPSSSEPISIVSSLPGRWRSSLSNTSSIRFWSVANPARA